ncbi:hypothetical protein B0H13DRAFT_1858942 [Mycena leptocephala]|nr:hypothetical protein B0H13DRAFT_1858942 [Mycena leptocephala]
MCDAQAPYVAEGLTHPAATIDTSEIWVRKFDGGGLFNAMVAGKGGPQEAILTVVGVLNRTELPPVKKNEIQANRVKYARQFASIIGYNTALYRVALGRISDVAYSMVTAVEDGQMAGWNPDEQIEELGTPLGSSARYFTVKRVIPEETKIPFGEYVEPAGVLARLEKDGVAHCMENDVAYLELKDKRFRPKDPSNFRAGDIVEMDFAIAAYRTIRAGEKTTYACRLVLRTLTLLSSAVTKDAYKRRTIAMQNKVIKQAPVQQQAYNPIAKRRQVEVEPDSDDDIPGTRMQIVNLTMNERASE